ncbi:MAG: KpsF/GutQ family sugar-phosphate isomerase [Rikenellaceae bacterium]
MISTNESKIIEFAKEVVTDEIDSLKRLFDYINGDFATVIELISNGKGRVIITGIGKSAIIGSKIVATLNSTGTPAIFMHAADAIHGDLGIVQKDDIVICISKSGNTPEIKVLIPLIRNLGYGNTIVAMVGNSESFLAMQSDYILDTTVSKEACPMNLAPTSSTTMQLVMGDALSMTLLHLRGFSKDDFAKVHPGGALGKRLYIKVSDILSGDAVPKVTEKATIDEVIVEISSKRLGATAVTDRNGTLVGIITDGDLRRMLQRKIDIGVVCAKDIMSCNPKTISKEELAVKAFSIMEDKKITQLLVTDSDGKYCGIVHIHDILREGVV